jgi:DNA primase small subunit
MKCVQHYPESVSFLDVASELHDRWQGNRRSSISKEDVNTARWEQLKTTLQSGKHKVSV